MLETLSRIQGKDHGIETYEINKISFLALRIKYTSKTIDVVD